MSPSSIVTGVVLLTSLSGARVNPGLAGAESVTLGLISRSRGSVAEGEVGCRGPPSGRPLWTSPWGPSD